MDPKPIDEEKLALEQRMSRMEKRLSINENKIDNQFWAFGVLTLLSYIGINSLAGRVDRVEDLTAGSVNQNPKGYVLLQEVKH